MSFQLKYHEGGRTGLVAQCDVCGRFITDASTANLCWDGFSDAQGRDFGHLKDKPGDLFRYRISCKDRCTRAIDQKYGHQFTQELDFALGCLFGNCGLNLKKMREKMALMRLVDP